MTPQPQPQSGPAGTKIGSDGALYYSDLSQADANCPVVLCGGTPVAPGPLPSSVAEVTADGVRIADGAAELLVYKNAAAGIALETAGVQQTAIAPAFAGDLETPVPLPGGFAWPATDGTYSYEVTTPGSAVHWAQTILATSAPESFRYTVDLPVGTTLVPDRGGAAIVDAAHNELLRVTAPATSDSAGLAVPTALQVDGSDIVIDVWHRFAPFSYPLAVDPFVLRGGERASDTDYTSAVQRASLHRCLATCARVGLVFLTARQSVLPDDPQWTYTVSTEYATGPGFTASVDYQCWNNVSGAADTACDGTDGADGPASQQIAQESTTDASTVISKSSGSSCPALRYAQLQVHLRWPSIGLDLYGDDRSEGVGVRMWDVRRAAPDCTNALALRTGFG